MMRLVSICLLGLATCSVATADVFELLNQRVCTGEQLSQAREDLNLSCQARDQSCVQKLLSVWTSNDWSQPAALLWACELADDNSLSLVLEAVKSKLSQAAGDSHVKERVDGFFNKAAITLCERVRDQEPVIKLALEAGYPFINYPVDQELLDEYLLQEIRGRKSKDSGGGSYAQYVSLQGLPAFLEYVKEELGNADALKNLELDGVQSAIDTLVAWSYTPALLELEGIWQRMPETTKSSHLGRKLEMYIAKLKWQDSRQELLSIVKGEHENFPLLSWAAWRLLQLGEDQEVLHKALKENLAAITEDSEQKRAVQSVLSVLFNESGGSLMPPDLRYLTNPLLLNQKEFAEYVVALRQGEVEKFTLKSIRERAEAAHSSANGSKG